MYQTAFISGASRGIGRAIAEALAGEGYHLSLTCEKNKEILEDFAEELRQNFHVQVQETWATTILCQTPPPVHYQSLVRWMWLSTMPVSPISGC